MIILHIGKIADDPCSGVCVAVPCHVIAQQKTEQVGFLNIIGDKLQGIENQFYYKDGLKILDLSEPFNKPDIAVFHEIYIPQFLKLAGELRQRGIPYVIVPHGGLAKQAQKKKRLKKMIANTLLFNKYIYGAASIQFLSEPEYNNKTFKVEGFIGTNGIDIPDRTKTEFLSDGINYLFIGRYEIEIKGIDLLFSAIRENKQLLSENKARFTMYGPDTNDGSCEVISNMAREYGIDHLVQVNGAITGEDKVQALLKADIFIQTSRTEGMPMGILEAMSYGLPCLITRGTNLTEFVDSNKAGFVCDTTIEGISKAIRCSVTAGKSFNEISTNAISAVSERFKWTRVTEETLNAYSAIIKND